MEILFAASENHTGSQLFFREGLGDIRHLLVICSDAALLDIAAGVGLGGA